MNYFRSAVWSSYLA